MKKALPSVIISLALLCACGHAGIPETTPRTCGQYADRLIPSDSYGRLIPYAGRVSDNDKCLSRCVFTYGLMTTDGTVVTAPIYSSVYAPGYYDGDGVRQTYPLLLLRQSVPDGGDGRGALAVAASDGSWCTGLDYRECTASPDGLVLIGDDSMTLMAPDGSIECELSRGDMGLSRDGWKELLLPESSCFYSLQRRRCGDYVVISCVEKDDGAYYRCYTLSTGELTDIYKYSFWDMGGRDLPADLGAAVANAWPLYDRLLGWDAPCLLESLQTFGEDDDPSPCACLYFRGDGTPLPELTYWTYSAAPRSRVTVLGGIIEVIEPHRASYYNLESMECVLRVCFD